VTAAVAVPAEAARPARPIAITASAPSASWQRAVRVPALGLPGDLGEEAGGAGWGQGLGAQFVHDLHVVVDVLASSG
jgi:hypothetical protein